MTVKWRRSLALAAHIRVCVHTYAYVCAHTRVWVCPQAAEKGKRRSER